MGTGTGGFKSNISPLVAEQYRISKKFISTTAQGERVIVGEYHPHHYVNVPSLIAFAHRSGNDCLKDLHVLLLLYQHRTFRPVLEMRVVFNY